MLIFMMIIILTTLTIIITTTDHCTTTVHGLLIATGTIITILHVNAVRSTIIRKVFQLFIQDHVYLTWAFIVPRTIPVRQYLQKVLDTVVTLLLVHLTTQPAAQAPTQEAAATTIVEAEAMPGTLSGKHSLIPETAAVAAIAQASRLLPAAL